jgi:hypothetical protein
MGELKVAKGPIDFGAGAAPAGEELGGAPPLTVNMLRDAGGWLSLWPGTTAWSWSPSEIPNASEIIGIYGWQGRLIYVTADRKIFAIITPGLVQELSDATDTDTLLDGGGAPVFAEDQTRVFIAGGGLIQYWDGGSGLSARVPGSPTASHIVFNAGRIVAAWPGRTGTFSFTEPLEALHITVAGWDALNFAQAEAAPDPLVALHENSNRIFLFGTTTLQAFAPDPNVAYAPLDALNVGCSAPRSIINVRDAGVFAWLNQDQEFVVGDGSQSDYLSRPFLTSTIKALATTSDCIGRQIRIGNWDLLVWTFPTEGRTFAYERTTKAWLEVRGYDMALGDWAPWPITAYHYWAEQDVHLVGLATGELLQLTVGATTQAGQLVVGDSITGFINRGTDQPKQTSIIRVPMRRGIGTFGATTSPKGELYYRDDTGSWSSPKLLDFGNAGQYKPFVEKRIVGKPYQRRQWRLRVSGVAASVGPVEETFEALED